jgi:hypothetical protein
MKECAPWAQSDCMEYDLTRLEQHQRETRAWFPGVIEARHRLSARLIKLRFEATCDQTLLYFSARIPGLMVLSSNTVLTSMGLATSVIDSRICDPFPPASQLGPCPVTRGEAAYLDSELKSGHTCLGE